MYRVYQEGARSGAATSILASKFTSGRSRWSDPAAGSGTVVDVSIRPAGLSLASGRREEQLHTEVTVLPTQEASQAKQAEDAPKDPTRSTLVWMPAPLLCKRLNVPVPVAVPHGSPGPGAGKRRGWEAGGQGWEGGSGASDRVEPDSAVDWPAAAHSKVRAITTGGLS